MPARPQMKINVGALTSKFQEINRSRETVLRVVLVMKTTMKHIMTRTMTLSMLYQRLLRL